MYGLESIGHVFIIGVVLFLGALLLLMPLFVWQLRNIAQSMNKKLSRIANHLDGQPAYTGPTKTCPHCHTVNAAGNQTCAHCGEAFRAY